MRTREQIIADCEKRFEEMRLEAERPEVKYPCSTCRFYSQRGNDGFHWSQGYPQYHTCTEPLVKGLSKWGVQFGRNPPPMPCGPEKALWQPKLTICERILAWFAGDPA